MKKLKNIFEELIDEEYPVEFDIEEFKKLNSFNKRIKYCEAKLHRISSGSGRIVYRIDDEKVLKLAKNQKGVAQNEVEEGYSHYHDIQDIVAKVFNVHPHSLWIEMELARKVTVANFKSITGYNWKDYVIAMEYESDRVKSNGDTTLHGISQELLQHMWDDQDGLAAAMFDFMPSYDVPVGDLTRSSSYGIVKRYGEDAIVMIDYGLTHDVYDGYYR